MTSALAATVLRSRVSVMPTMMSPDTAIETCGVRFRAWSFPRARGSPPSRPMANATRLEEKIREFRAARAPRATPNTMIWVPYGITCAAISAIALLLPTGPPGDAGVRQVQQSRDDEGAYDHDEGDRHRGLRSPRELRPAVVQPDEDARSEDGEEFGQHSFIETVEDQRWSADNRLQGEDDAESEA